MQHPISRWMAGPWNMVLFLDYWQYFDWTRPIMEVWQLLNSCPTADFTSFTFFFFFFRYLRIKWTESVTLLNYEGHPTLNLVETLKTLIENILVKWKFNELCLEFTAVRWLDVLEMTSGASFLSRSIFIYCYQYKRVIWCGWYDKFWFNRLFVNFWVIFRKSRFATSCKWSLFVDHTAACQKRPSWVVKWYSE